MSSEFNFVRSMRKYDNLDEINPRQEVLDLFSGEDFGWKKYYTLLIRHFVKDDNLNKIECSVCYDKIKNEGRKDCKNCHGYGYIFKDYFTTGLLYKDAERRINLAQNYYKTQSQRSEFYPMGCILMHDVPIDATDIIYALEAYENGKIKYPFVFEDIYFVNESLTYRNEENKFEFTWCTLSHE